MSEFYSRRLTPSQEIDRVDVHVRSLIEVKRDYRSAVFNQRLQRSKMFRAQSAKKPNRSLLSVEQPFDHQSHCSLHPTRLARLLLQDLRHFRNLEFSAEFAQFLRDCTGSCAGVAEIADVSALQRGRRSDACAKNSREISR